MATVRVGDTAYDFAATCYTSGADDLLVVGVAKDPESGRLIEMYLQAYVADPYIGLKLADGTLVEPALDSPLDIQLQDDVVRASAVRFVRILDLDTGESEEYGLGDVEAVCFDCSEELPPGG